MNIQESEKKTYDPIEPGIYTATIVEATASADGNYIQMRLDVGEESSVFDRIYSDNATRARFVCSAIGKDWDGTVNPEDLLNKTASIDVVVMEKDGKTFNKIVTWKPAADDVPSTPTPKAVKAQDIPF